MNIKDKLTSKWSKKDNDIIVNYPLGIGTNTDMCYFFNNILDRNKCLELEKRGYDLSTLKFEISPKLPNIDKFKTLTKKYKI